MTSDNYTMFLLGLLMLHLSSVYGLFLDGRAYENITVVISRGVPEGTISATTGNPELIDTIKEWLTEGSAAVYTATGKRVYFGSFTIIVPETWTSVAYPESTLTTSSPDVIIEKPQRDGYGSSPYVKHYEECGKPGIYIHFTNSYFTGLSANSVYGPAGKVIAHEWGHYRYGVFDEYPINAQGKTGDWVDGNGEQQTCTANMNMRKVTVPNGDRYYPNPTQAKASIMTVAYGSVETFCDSSDNADTMHNKDANNKMNMPRPAGCGGRAAMDVVLDHVDFSGEAKTPMLNTDTTPVFNIVKGASRRVVFVLDMSGSMGGSVSASRTRIALQHEAVTALIMDEDTIPNNIYIGVVGFSSAARIEASMTEVTSRTTRQNIAANVPSTASGSTAIGLGIQKGIELVSQFGDPAGAELIVLTDGGENINPFIHEDEVRGAVLNKSVIIHSVLYTSGANPQNHDLSKLARETKGKTLYEDGQDQTDLIRAFSTVFQCQDGDPNTLCSRAAKLVLNTTSIPSGGTYTGSFTVHASQGHITSITLIFPDNVSVTSDVTLTDPNGNVHNATTDDLETLSNGKTIKLTIKGRAEAGNWQYTITNPLGVTVEMQVFVKTSPPDGEEGLKVRSWTSSVDVDVTDRDSRRLKIYTEVTQSKVAILNAVVTAVVTEGANQFTVKLKDNGAGGDVTRDDGIYTGYFMQYRNDGIYTVQVTASNDGSAVIQTAGRVGAYPIVAALNGNADALLTPTYAPVAAFTTTQNGDYFAVENTAAMPADLDAPATVTDFTLQDAANNTINVTFTATGDDLTFGKASNYSIRRSNNKTLLRDQFEDADNITEDEVLSGNLNNPAEPGDLEQFQIMLPNVTNNESVYLAVKVVDDVGSTSDVSNIITFSGQSVGGVSDDSSDSPNTTRVPTELIAIGGAVFALAIIIFVVATVYAKHKNKNEVTTFGEQKV